MKRYRISTEDGDTFVINAKSIEDARKIARDVENIHCRFTVYEEKERR